MFPCLLCTSDSLCFLVYSGCFTLCSAPSPCRPAPLPQSAVFQPGVKSVCSFCICGGSADTFTGNILMLCVADASQGCGLERMRRTDKVRAVSKNLDWTWWTGGSFPGRWLKDRCGKLAKVETLSNAEQNVSPSVIISSVSSVSTHCFESKYCQDDVTIIFISGTEEHRDFFMATTRSVVGSILVSKD